MGWGAEIFVEKDTFTSTEWKDMEASEFSAPVLPLGCPGPPTLTATTSQVPLGMGQLLSTTLEYCGAQGWELTWKAAPALGSS